MKIINSVVLFFLLSVSAGWSQDRKYSVYTENLEPISYVKGNRIDGIATEIVREVFRRADIEVVIVVYPWVRTYRSVLEDKNGFVYALLRNEKRENLFQWIGPILIRESSFWALKERVGITPVDDLEALKKYRIGVVREESIHQILLQKGFENYLESVADSTLNALKLIHGRVDVIPGNNYTIAFKFKKIGYPNTLLREIYKLQTGGYYIGANKNVPGEVVNRLQQAMAEIKASDYVERAHQKYSLEYDKKLYWANGFGKSVGGATPTIPKDKF